MKHVKLKMGLPFILILVLLNVFGFTGLAYSDMQTSKSYTYDEKGNDVNIPDAYTYKTTIQLVDNEELGANNPQHFFISNTNKIYVVDTDNDRIMVFKSDFTFEKSLTDFTDNGEITGLNKPEGIFVL